MPDIARNSVDGGRIIYLIDKGIIKDLKFPTYRLDNNAQGKFMLSIVFGQSKYYVDALSENIKRGIRQKLRKGVWPQWAPLGYLNDKQTRTIVVDRERAPLIKKAFELYSTGTYSLARLRDTINACGLTGKKGKTLAIANYQYILKNPIYYGLIRFNGEIYEGNNWFEQAKTFVTSLNKASYIVQEGNLESQKEFLQKIGSNFILKERLLNFSYQKLFYIAAVGDEFQNWRRGGDSASPSTI